MQPETLNAWIRIFRDIIIVILGTFMVFYGVTRITEPAVLTIVLGGGLTLLGVPAGIRVDALRRSRKENGNGNGERWSHLP